MGAEVTGIFDIEILNYLSLGFVPECPGSPETKN
jgi:hypothetical protein